MPKKYYYEKTKSVLKQPKIMDELMRLWWGLGSNF